MINNKLLEIFKGEPNNLEQQYWTCFQFFLKAYKSKADARTANRQKRQQPKKKKCRYKCVAVFVICVATIAWDRQFIILKVLTVTILVLLEFCSSFSILASSLWEWCVTWKSLKLLILKSLKL